MDIISLAENGALCPLLFLLMALIPVDAPTKILPSSFSEDDFKYSKYLKCVQVAGGQTLQDIVRKFYARSSMRTRNGTMPLRWFNMRANVDPYYGDMDCLLDCNIMEEDFDITFLYKILKEPHICGEFYKSTTSYWQEKVMELVKQRNKICHKYGGVHDFDQDILSLKSCIKEIYEKAGKSMNKKFKMNINFETNVLQMTNLLDEISRAEIMADCSADYLTNLENFKRSLRFKLLVDGRQELSYYYGKLRTLSPCTWIDESEHADRFNLEKIFTPPKLWDNKYEGDIPMEELMVVKMKNKEVPNALFIKGLAGSGKTSLCRYIAHSWYKKTNDIQGLQEFDLVFLIEIGSSSSENITEYLREELLSNTCSEFKAEDLIPLLQELDLLFIIDGYDEQSDRATKLVEDIFNKFHSKRIILSTRLDYQEEIEDIAKRCVIQFLPITLRGFDDSKQKDFSKKVFQAVNRSYEDFWMYLDGRGKVLQAHLTLPLTISLLIVLWMENSKIVNKITTATRLYYEIFCLYQEKLVTRLITNLKGRGEKKLRDKVSKLLLTLGEQAWVMLLKGCGCELARDSRTALENMCKDRDQHIDIEPFEILSAFLMCDFDHSADGNCRKYYFLHRTQMEYLASDFLAESIKTGKMKLKDINEQVPDWKGFSEVIVYLIGNMSKKNILRNSESEILKFAERTNTDSTDYCYWWKLVSESGIEADIPECPNKPIRYKTLRHPEIAKTIDRLHLSGTTNWTLNHKNVAAGLRLMSLVSPMQLLATTLVINIPQDVDPFKIADFYDALTAVSYHQNQKQKIFKVKVELYLRYHDIHVTDRTSYQFISALKGWAELQNFIGNLREVADFSGTRQLKTINCLVIAPQTLESFTNISESVRTLRITLGSALMNYPPESLVQLKFDGNLELFFPHMKDKDLNWLIAVVRRLSSSDLKYLHLEHSELTYKCIMDLIKSLKDILSRTLYITPPDGIKNRELEMLENKAKFTIEWKD